MLRPRLSLGLTGIIIAVVLAVISGAVAAAANPDADVSSGFRVLRGREAASFRVPNDVRLVFTWTDSAHGLTYERYQQFVQPFGAIVDGGQLTVVRRGQAVEAVIGAHFTGLAPSNRLLVDSREAIGRAMASRALPNAIPERVRTMLQSRTELRIDPANGRLLQRVESATEGVHVFHEVDAETGAVIDAWDALAHQNGMGTGVKSDRKSLQGEDAVDPSDDLTKQVGGIWQMRSVDGRVSTWDARRDNRYYTGISVLADNLKASWANDNDWKAGYERPAVDAQYYANLTDEWFRDS